MTGQHRFGAALTARERGSGARVVVAASALSLLTLLGTLGFAWIEDLAPLDALYMAVITLSTVGYQDVAPATAAGRLYTIAFIMVGVGVAFYTVVAVAEFVLEGRLRNILGRRSMDRDIESLKGHVIICGFGRLGRTVVDELKREGIPLVVVESDPALQPELAAEGVLSVVGSALDDGVLQEARLTSARAIVVATSSDADNVFIALSARELNPDIAVHARAETQAGLRRLRLAGAHQVISVHTIAGQRLANAIVRPAVVDFLELAAVGGEAPIDLEEVELGEGCALSGRALADIGRDALAITVVAIKRAGEGTRLHPGPADVLRAGDHIVVVGDEENLTRLAALAQAQTGSEPKGA
jgi:voltage-gated potassium channel